MVRLKFWIVSLLFTTILILPPISNAQETELDISTVLQQGRDVPFDVCLEAKTWVRPTEVEQREHVWRDPRYGSEEDQKALPE